MAIRKPRFQWRGLERQILIKLKRALQMIDRRDDRAFNRAQTLGVTAYLFATDDTDPVAVAMGAVNDRINACLAAKV